MEFSFLRTVWIEGLSSCLVVGYTLLGEDLSKMASCFINLYKPRMHHKESSSEREVIILSNLIMETIFCHI